jgi:hypothetical protein
MRFAVHLNIRQRNFLVRKLVYAGIVLLLTSCEPIGVRVQNMLAMWTA